MLRSREEDETIGRHATSDYFFVLFFIRSFGKNRFTSLEASLFLFLSLFFSFFTRFSLSLQFRARLCCYRGQIIDQSINRSIHNQNDTRNGNAVSVVLVVVVVVVVVVVFDFVCFDRE